MARRLRITAVAVLAAVFALTAGGTVVGTAARADSAPPAPGTGWTTVFDDDFAGPLAALPPATGCTTPARAPASAPARSRP